MHAMVVELKNILEKNADPVLAGPMSAYMRGQFPYLGLKSPLMAELHKQFFAEFGLPPLEDLETILRELWALPEREYQYTATGLLSRFERQLPPEFISTIEYLLVNKSWWDTVDTIAGNTVGVHFKRYPQVREDTLPRWRGSENFWLRRSALLFQLKYKKETDFVLLGEIIRENLGSKEFFINKAIGWALRQYAWTNPLAVRDFVAQTDLHPLSRREAMKHLQNIEN